MLKRQMLSLIPALLLAACAPAQVGGGAGAGNPDVLFTFSTVGDSREDPTTEGLSAQNKLWLQNTRAWSRIMNEANAQGARALFFNGDMIMGYTTDRVTLDRQYAFWRGMAATLMERGTYVMPVAGNHEVQEKGTDAAGKGFKLARVGNEDAWRANMGDLIMDAGRWKSLTGLDATAFDPANTPVIGGADKVSTDQTRLTYSFDAGGSHFVVINTDAVGWDSHAPAAWLARDLAAARARGAAHLFVFGHKPAYTYKYNDKVPAGGIDTDPENQQAFWNTIETYNATYFSGHEHIYHADQPTRAQGGKAWQVIVGSGGSPFEAKPGDSQNPQDRMYAWVTVQVMKNGQVHVDAYGFDEKYGPTQKLASWNL
ncbi:metallophosphoesterase (plasmid) [Deinococcus sp. KNUC1210]|uniref:metallophosphoesterase family protein n=1 Tax=Deinococcus sp. KNUC1210 TaxID=2917691 RepID=UPI001EEF980B|nr:metallophosphoesterase family protein [Deinococcus sp. KNUC1210]ULH13864.1 metallophosphoesterase [Deinococcus sp. KNUC1210]